MAAAAFFGHEQQREHRPTGFLRCGSKWHRHLSTQVPDAHRLREVSVSFHIRDAFRSGYIWLAHSRCYADLKRAVVPIEATRSTPKLTVPFEPESWAVDRKSRLAQGLERPAKAARNEAIQGGSIENGVLKIDHLSSAVPEETDTQALDLYDRLPSVCITDLLLEVDDETGFTEAFTLLRSRSPRRDRVGLLAKGVES